MATYVVTLINTLLSDTPLVAAIQEENTTQYFCTQFGAEMTDNHLQFPQGFSNFFLESPLIG